jgi:histidinol-phosphate aminotransferase
VLAAIRALAPEDVAFYPDSGPATSACERALGVPAGWVLLTNGLDEGLHLVAQSAAIAAGRAAGNRAGGGPHVLFAEPAFEMYAAAAEAARLEVVRVHPGRDLAFPESAVLAAISPATAAIYLTDPNNPTGLAIAPGAIERVAAAAPWATVLVDEAYADFSGRTAIGALLERHRNLVVGRTFSKAHGLAALRAGALVAHPDTLAPIRRIQPPFSLNVCALRGIEAALADRAHVDWSIAQSVESRRLVYEFCDRHGLRYWPSEANFVLVELGGDVPALVDRLAAQGVLIRDRSRAPGCAGCARITAAVVDRTRRGLEALEALLAASRH